MFQEADTGEGKYKSILYVLIFTIQMF